MGRKRRPNLTGVPFHLTARVQGPDPLFRGLEPRITELVLHYAVRARMQLLAWAVMPNHLHIVAVQGDLPLWLFMQPLLRRVAFQVGSRTGREGHVFVRRYAALPILTADHLRSAIVYVHLNPVRAAICDSPDAAVHTSHAQYCRASEDDPIPSRLAAAIELALRLFSTSSEDSLSSCRCNYLRFIRWRIMADSADAAEVAAATPPAPDHIAGDIQWDRQYGRVVDRFAAAAVAQTRTAPDLEAIARSVIADVPGATLDWLRSGDRLHRLSRVRRIVIARCVAAGHANHQIARYLSVSPSTISKVRSSQPLPVLRL